MLLLLRRAAVANFKVARSEHPVGSLIVHKLLVPLLLGLNLGQELFIIDDLWLLPRKLLIHSFSSQ